MTETTGRKRVRRDPETTRGLILDMTERLMVEEGYASVSSRRIAQELGLNAATIHYYYPTTDALFVALHQRMTDRQQEELARVLAAEDPLQAFWQFQSGWSKTALGVEFLALANHRKAIAETLAAATARARAAGDRALHGALGGITLAGEPVPPPALAAMLIAVGRLLANEERVGISHGHAEVRHLVERILAMRHAGQGAVNPVGASAAGPTE